MHLSCFEARDFRNIVSCRIPFTPGVNLLVGDNAQGKTNVLEGIYYFARGKSFRGAGEQELTRIGKDGFSLTLSFRDQRREQSLQYEKTAGGRRRTKNGAPITMQEMLGAFRAVLFYPEHLQIVKAGPEKRRDFLNVAVAGTDPSYVRLYASYVKILENRNALLKQAAKGLPVDREELIAWSESLAAAAATVYARRCAYIKGFAPIAADLMSELTGGRERLHISYRADVTAETEKEAEDTYRKLLTDNLARESFAGCTLFGVHRDDMIFTLSDMDARTFASQGQQRSIVLALKLAEGEYNRMLTGEYPVYLFDDVLSELDVSRRAYLLGLGRGERQLILTSCEGELGHAADHEISVSGGQYVSAYR